MYQPSLSACVQIWSVNNVEYGNEWALECALPELGAWAAQLHNINRRTFRMLQCILNVLWKSVRIGYAYNELMNQPGAGGSGQHERE
jgi:hypothetical protein